MQVVERHDQVVGARRQDVDREGGDVPGVDRMRGGVRRLARAEAVAPRSRARASDDAARLARARGVGLGETQRRSGRRSGPGSGGRSLLPSRRSPRSSSARALRRRRSRAGTARARAAGGSRPCARTRWPRTRRGSRRSRAERRGGPRNSSASCLEQVAGSSPLAHGETDPADADDVHGGDVHPVGDRPAPPGRPRHRCCASRAGARTARRDERSRPPTASGRRPSRDRARSGR